MACRELRQNRVLIMKQLRHADIKELLEAPKISQQFSQRQKEDILSHKVSSERIVKILDLLETKGNSTCEDFIDHLRRLNLNSPFRRTNSLSSGSNDSRSPSPGEDRSMAEHGEDTAGLYGLNGHRPGPGKHLNELSYNSREILARALNGTPANREDFCLFCQVYGVENSLKEASLRSRNPTAYLIQELASRPDATLKRLRDALERIGRGELFNDLNSHHREEEGGDCI